MFSFCDYVHSFAHARDFAAELLKLVYASLAASRAGDDELLLLSRHAATAPRLASLDFVQCSFSVTALTSLTARMHALQRLAVCTCGLDASTFVALLKVLPESLVALDVSGNAFSKLGPPASKSRRLLTKSLSREYTALAGGVTQLGRLPALRELRMQRSFVSGPAMENIAQGLQVRLSRLLNPEVETHAWLEQSCALGMHVCNMCSIVLSATLHCACVICASRHYPESFSVLDLCVPAFAA